MSEYFLGVGPASLPRPSVVITDFSSWQVTNNLDEGCSISFNSRGVSLGASLIGELETDVWLYRNGQIVQRFRITSLTQEWDFDGNDIIDVQAVCYRRIFQSRHVLSTLTFTGVGQGDIIAGLIAHTQGQPIGDLGITFGALDNSVLRTRIYQPGDNIFEMITDFTRVANGVAWEIDGNLTLTVRPFFDYPLRSTPIQLGATAQSMSRPSNAEQFANVAIVSGDVEATNIVILGTPGLVSDPRGRWERVVALSGEQNQSALEERAFGTLDTALSPPSTWTVDLVPFRYETDLDLEVGELVALVEPPSIAYRSGPADAILLQIVDRNLSYTADGDETVTVSGVEITAPNPILTLAQARLSVLGAAPNQKAAGGTVTTDGQFLYHTFTTTESFIPLPEFGPLAVECLLVGGGGGGGSGGAAQGGGGGGAGQVLSNVGSPISLSVPTGVFIGAGGLGGTAGSIFAPSATNGSQTSFAGFTAVGGGRGAGLGAPPGGGGYAANDGASGGGAKVSAPAGGTGTAGNNGGSYVGTSGEAGGAGGGGAGAPGSDVDDMVSINKIGGAGGAGAIDTFLNVPTARAGGGGGGYYFVPPFIFQPFVRDGAAGGAGGGGHGGGASGADRNGQIGVPGSGGGGGGGSFEFSGSALFGDGGNGGSGIVIIRYLA